MSNDGTIGGQVFDGYPPLDPPRRPDPARAASVRNGPDPSKSKSIRPNLAQWS